MIAQLLAELELLPHGTTTNFGAGGGIPASRMPTGESHPPHEYWRERFKGAQPHEHSRLIEQAQAELQAWRKRPAIQITEETSEQYELRMIAEGEGWAAEDVAKSFNCLPKQVRKIRAKHDRLPATGKPVASLGPSSDQAARAKEMVANGFTERQMRLILKCGGSTIERLLAA
jgi:hypothetical protein